MTGFISLLACMTFCLILIIAVFIGGPRTKGSFTKRHRDVVRRQQSRTFSHLPDYSHGRFYCASCASQGIEVSFERAGDLMEHEIQLHPSGRF